MTQLLRGVLEDAFMHINVTPDYGTCISHESESAGAGFGDLDGDGEGGMEFGVYFDIADIERDLVRPSLAVSAALARQELTGTWE